MIKAERLTLKPFDLADFDAYRAMSREDSTSPSNEEGDWGRFQLLAGHWALFGYGTFGVFETASGRCVGETGLARCHRGLGPDFDDHDEASWVIHPDWRGRGYGLEAAVAAHDWRDRRSGDLRSVCMISPSHGRSIRIAEKLGYRPYRAAVYNDMKHVLYERLP